MHRRDQAQHQRPRRIHPLDVAGQRLPYLDGTSMATPHVTSAAARPPVDRSHAQVEARGDAALGSVDLGDPGPTMPTATAASMSSCPPRSRSACRCASSRPADRVRASFRRLHREPHPGGDNAPLTLGLHCPAATPRRGGPRRASGSVTIPGPPAPPSSSRPSATTSYELTDGRRHLDPSPDASSQRS